uniref:Uncharacterized protein n=1 Tax=viral metagenome TaxID=1070528 RepID=A0A6C0CKM7_9ZZZZ
MRKLKGVKIYDEFDDDYISFDENYILETFHTRYRTDIMQNMLHVSSFLRSSFSYKELSTIAKYFKATKIKIDQSWYGYVHYQFYS